MKYQDELEAGKRSRKEGMTLAQQLEHYRKKLLSKVKGNQFRILSSVVLFFYNIINKIIHFKTI